MKKLFIATAAAAAASMTLAAAPVSAERPHYSNSYNYERAGYRDNDRGGYSREGYNRGGYSEYDSYGRYNQPRRIGRGDRTWRGNDGQYYCERDNGTTGLIIGAAGGALLGRAVDTHGERTTGTILGALFGGLLGKSIDQNSDARCR